MNGRHGEHQGRAKISMWINEKAAAEMTGLSVHTLRAHRLHRKGLPYAKVGRSVRYSTDDVAAFMAAARIEPTQ